MSSIPAVIRAVRGLTLLAGLSLGLLGSAHAATSLQFSPTHLQLRSTQRSTLVTIRNVAAQSATFSAELMLWNQDGQDRYAPSRDFVINPARFTLAPGQEQTVRLAWRGTPVTQERSYRLYIQELPSSAPVQPASTDGTSRAQVNTLYRVGLPLFVTPATQVSRTPEVQFALERGPSGHRIIVRNAGPRYTLVRDLQVVAGGQTTAPQSFNLLRGGVLAFPLPSLTGVKTLEVRARYGASDQVQRLTLPVGP